jgi:uncharacterized membrane protein YgcG
MHLPQLPAKVFDPPPVACPGCYFALKDAVPSCPHCGYDAWSCVEKFPWIPPPLERIMDVDDRLAPEERTQIEKSAEVIEQSFPQVRIHVCLGRLHPDTDPREFGFWLFNASVPPDDEAASHRPWSILLVIDRASRRASLTLGYGLDPFLSDRRLTACLESAAGDFTLGRYGQGTLTCLRRLHAQLINSRRDASYIAAKFRQSFEDGTVSPDMLIDCISLARRSPY